MDEMEQPKNWFQRRNWWKIGFFVMLFAFEFVREIAVLNINNPPTIIANATVGQLGPYISARGRWTRLDKDEDLVPSSVSIECNEASKECTEASVMVLDGGVGTPNVSRFPAKFEQDSVSYQNDTPACVTYSTRIDLKLKKAFSVRDHKKDAQNDELCKGTEERIEMVLGDGWKTKKDPLDDHFVPFMRVLAAVAKL